MTRNYTKRDESYWNRRSSPAAPAQTPIIVNTAAPAAAPSKITPFPDIGYGSTQISHGGGIPDSGTNMRVGQHNSPGRDPDGFQNVRGMPLPWAGFGDNRNYIGMKDAIELCARAYTGVSALRNAIEVAVEFSSQPFYIKTDNSTVKTFFKEWFHAVGMPRLKEEFFREYYRSGNVFLYKFSGKFGPAYYKNFQQSFGSKNNRIPIRYSILNPANVFVPNGLTFPYTYVRLLSIYEIERLRRPLTEQDKQVYNDLPQFVKDQIDVTSGYPQGIYIPMDPTRLRFAFYKKQSYEPLAVPMGYPVLPDIEWKLALKKMDMSLARTIEHAILLVTTGETASQYNGGNGINPNNIARLQNLFTNQTVGRVLVADFTTEAEWLIPDIQEILGPDKYKIVNQDIQDGLQSIIGGAENKFANAQIKAKIFIQRLKEGQAAFLHDFLIPEIVQICEDMGFRTVPTIGFRKIDLQDEMVAARIYTQLGQLGILTAEQVVKALETSVLPDASEMKTAQVQYQKDREDGMYLPLVGASKQDGDGMGGDGAVTTPTKKKSSGPAANGRPSGTTGIKQAGPRKTSPLGTSKAYSSKEYLANLVASEGLTNELIKSVQKRFKVKELTAAQSKIVDSLADIIMSLNPRDKWVESIARTIINPQVIPSEITSEIDEIAASYEVDRRDAILLLHSKTKAVEPKEV